MSVRRSIHTALFMLVLSGCIPSSVEDRVYTPIACAPTEGDCDGRLHNGCEATVSESDCCGQVCSAGQVCNGGRRQCL